MNKLMFYWAKFFKKIKTKAIKNSSIHPTSKVESGSEIVNSTMDKYSFCGYDCEIINCDIGSFCSIANRVVIGGGMHPMEWVSTSPVFYEGKDSVKEKFYEHKRRPPERTKIGNDVWIGEYSILKQGITVGHGAVIGMGSVVTKDVEPFSIVAGCPAKEIRKRFDSETIDALLKSGWWDFSDEELFKYGKFFNDPQEFLKNLNL